MATWITRFCISLGLDHLHIMKLLKVLDVGAGKRITLDVVDAAVDSLKERQEPRMLAPRRQVEMVGMGR